MCLIVSREYHWADVFIPSPRKCDKDILVFKALNRKTVCFFDDITGAFNCDFHFMGSWTSYPSSEFETPYMKTDVSFKDGMDVLETPHFSCGYDTWGRLIIEQGIHTGTHIGTARGYGDFIFFAVIPAGTEFYVGEMSDMVSTKIIIFESLETFEKYKETHEVIDCDEYEKSYKTDSFFDNKND